MSQQENNEMQQHFYRASAVDFIKIPSSPIAYWVSDRVRSLFSECKKIDDIAVLRTGMHTGNNERFLRYWFEVSSSNIGFGYKTSLEASKSDLTWFPYNKGGSFRKWFGNNEYVVNWKHDGLEIHEFHKLPLDYNGAPVRAKKFQFKQSLTWTATSSSYFGIRHSDHGFLFDVKGSSGFCEEKYHYPLLGYLVTSMVSHFLRAINPSIEFQNGDVKVLPICSHFESAAFREKASNIVRQAISIARSDWDSYESSWGFTRSPMSMTNYDLKVTYQHLRTRWSETILEMQRLEEENNSQFIDAYGLQDEITPEVPLSEITLTCNPHYRYGGNLTDEEREARLQSDTICELISYVIGCMMGRYSLDREGLVYAHAGNEGFKALVEEGAYATFAADEDGILPLSTDSWFEDDVATRLEAFVCTVWGTETLEENLQFIADSLCLAAIKPVKKGGETSRETLRRYLSTQFFKDHMKTYKKRPIYWLFSSGKEKAFECLVYLHRYNEATLPRMRTEYVTPLLGQMAGRIERLRLQQTEASTAEAKRIGKEIDSLIKQLAELRAFDDQLKHHADMRITLDLDDGVKVNYGKFGSLLSDVKAITGDKG
ncbi:BREX-1 system adenine-specific DNA-methyltransferase PglX [Aeromonas hydrophila]|uniref:BREX-1 system adenine-specific DNA-methyltransferase PglX n=1 Tax=Aeromonas hydrophila TaxID=644 RepID=UPI0011155E16|nr:BREX-1 system adenine-specific DNA-methyltransferase PglX [Aeromonas hydrophila]